MHEIAIASKVLKEAENAGATKFVKVEVGELVEITPKELEEGLRKISRGDIHIEEKHKHENEKHPHTHDIDKNELKKQADKTKGWKFEVKFVKSKIKCFCGYSGKAHIVDRGHGYCIFNCPTCGKKPKVLEGGEIKIVGVE